MARRVLVTGSRTWQDRQAVRDALDGLLAEHADLIVVQGGAAGADSMAVEWVMDRSTWQEAQVSHETHPANWRRHGRRAGMIRNAEMVKSGADLCLAFIRDGSPGATHCAALAERAGIPVRRITSLVKTSLKV